MRLNRSLAILASCLLFFGALSAIPSVAVAQQQEKRIALVIGNGAYTKVPLATAANDGGLIAQTLQAAGFDVAGARDLDGDTLRKAFRDFVKKAEESGPDTVAVVYLAGYGIQLAGENYFIPVDTTIARDTDIPIEGLRISDYMRQLAALPLKVSVVVLDIAREQPFIQGGQPIASGLALVEPNPRMLIAFNAAPGTVAPDEPGPYGAYAQALAEMIRTGGLSLPELFNRVRLRVNETTKGAQVPWDTQKVDDAQFMFFDRAPDAPTAAVSDQAIAARNKPIRDLGTSDAYVAALERDTLQGYEDFLAAYPRDAMAKRVRAIVAARREAITWRRSYRADTPDAYWSYLRRYPRGPHAADARRRLAILTAALEPPPTFAMIDYDVPPPPPDEIIYVDRPVLMFSDPEFDFEPPPPPPVFFLPPPPADFVVLEPPPPPVGLFFLPRPLFVPIPTYVRAPTYVRPPPNNIIFTNIHNTTVINNVINRPPPAAAVNPAAPVVNPVAPNAAPGARTAPQQAPVVQAGAGPALPAAVMQKATLIQQGKAPVPPSASINPAAKAGLAAGPAGRLPGPRRAAPAAGAQAQPGTPQPATTPPATAPAATGQPPATAAQPGQPAPGAAPTSKQLPKTNALPVPGAKGAPPAPVAPAAGTLTKPGAPQPATAAPAATAPAGKQLPKTNVLPVPGAKGAPPAPAAPGPAPAVTAPTTAPKPGTATSPLKPQIQSQPQRQIQRPGPAPRTAPAPVAPPRAAPPPHAPAARPAASPPRAAPAARPATPPPHAAPPPRVVQPPRPAPPPRVAAPPRPAPPPPRMAAPPRAAPPPPRMAPPPPRAAPPPPPRAAPPPPRPAPVARPAPPPRPAAPAAKKCPPNVAKC